MIASELVCHPKQLLTDPPQEVQGRHWHVVHTLARQEKSLARDLLSQGIPYFLPLRPRKLTYRGRTSWTYLPVYSGIVFIFANQDERRTCLETGRVATILDVADQATLQQELLQVAATLSPTNDPAELRLGQRTRFESRPSADAQPSRANSVHTKAAGDNFLVSALVR